MTAIIANVGALVGGAVCGYASQYLGRRRTIIVAMVLLGAFLPLFVLPRSRVLLTIGAFFVYFFVQVNFLTSMILTLLTTKKKNIFCFCA